MLISLLLLSASFASEPVIAPLHLLEKLKVKIVDADPQLGVGMANVTEAQRAKLSQWSHEAGKCGGYEWISAQEKQPLAGLRAMQLKQFQLTKSIQKKESIIVALKELKEENLRTHIEWLSAFPSRNSRQADPNRHVNELETKLRDLLSSYPGMWTIEQISHQRTPQKSLRVRLTGKSFPKEVVVLGGHLDSINQSWGTTAAPGADDNASGSANLIETLRVFLQQGIPARTVEFYWYAAEEQGLVGSSEIATQYKKDNVDVVSVLQLDMTSFPGNGEFVIGNVTDFTSAWLRQLLAEVNDIYLQVRMVEDKCGYACSDHASWYRQGYSTLLPFEATTSTMNRKIHSEKDLLDSTISLRHSLVFSKIALAYAMELANSRERGSAL